MKPQATVFAVGHSTPSLEEVIGLLQQNQIQVLADIRAFPLSARYLHFNRNVLAHRLTDAGITYHWLGKMLGGYREQTDPNSPLTALHGS